MKRKLLDAIETLSIENLSDLEAINECVADRLGWLELREPDYDSSEWNDKYDMLSDAADALDEALDWYYEIDNADNKHELLNAIQKNIEEAVSNIKCLQSLYGGLSRLTI